MATNNFKKLGEEAEKQHPHAPPEIENKLMGSMRMTHFMGNVVELYLPRIFDMILSLFGAKQESEKKIMDVLDDENSEGDSDDVPTGSPKSDQ